MAAVPPKVFISYSHDSVEHKARVLRFAQQLRSDGVDAQIDQFIGDRPPGGWSRWMLDKLDWAEFVLLICTDTYYRRFRGNEERSKGTGVDWEEQLITLEHYQAKSRTAKFVPVIFGCKDEKFIPEPLRAHSYRLDSEDSYRELYEVLFGHDDVPGLTLRYKLCGGEGPIRRIAWSPDGRLIAAPGGNGEVTVWNAENGSKVYEIAPGESTTYTVAWSPDGHVLATGGQRGDISLWSTDDGRLLKRLNRHPSWVNTLAWSAAGILASGSEDGTIRLWNVQRGVSTLTLLKHEGNINGLAWAPDHLLLASASGDGGVGIWDGRQGKLVSMLRGHQGWAFAVSWSPDGRLLASASLDTTIRIWDPDTKQTLHVLEGHTANLSSLSFSSEGRLLASKSADNTVRLWRCDTWQCARVIHEISSGRYSPSLAFNPRQPVLATLGEKDCVIRVWDLRPELMLESGLKGGETYYRNAKVVLVGDAGVGKSALATVMTGEKYREMESSHGRHVWIFETREERTGVAVETRETLLWDLAGQPGYRLVNQMYLHEIAIALVVFDARSETDPLAGVRHWVRALRQAAEREGIAAVPLKMFLVIGRSDRTGVPISMERIAAIRREMGFENFFETSAREGWRIQELTSAIRQEIRWESLPRVTSTALFQKIKQFLLNETKSGRRLCTGTELFRSFRDSHPEVEDEGLRSKFDACIGRLENRDLVRRLSFGGHVLLQPQLLDAYASAIIDSARAEPDGFGSILEADVLHGSPLRMSSDIRIADKGEEELVLLATVKELLEHDLALREQADDGQYLVFPSQALRDWPAASEEPPGKVLTCRFEGPVQNLYATLAVRVGHSGFFETDRTEMWRNAAMFRAKLGGRCGIYLRESFEGRGTLTIFVDRNVGVETRRLFENYVIAHLTRRALAGSLRVERSFLCSACGLLLPDAWVAKLRERKEGKFECACGNMISLEEPKERSEEKHAGVAQMDKFADASRNLASAAMTLEGKVKTNDFDVFLCYNSGERVAAKTIGEELKTRAILPWLDEWNLRPGFPWQDALEEQIKTIKAAAVLVGPDGVGPWQNRELAAFIRKFVARRCPVIPVLLKGLETIPELPTFFEGFQAVDFRKAEPDPMDQLIWGITGERRTEAMIKVNV